MALLCLAAVLRLIGSTCCPNQQRLLTYHFHEDGGWERGEEGEGVVEGSAMVGVVCQEGRMTTEGVTACRVMREIH